MALPRAQTAGSFIENGTISSGAEYFEGLFQGKNKRNH
jgi:hypothetical protein